MTHAISQVATFAGLLAVPLVAIWENWRVTDRRAQR
jgi:hypothetical protein